MVRKFKMCDKIYGKCRTSSIFGSPLKLKLVAGEAVIEERNEINSCVTNNILSSSPIS